MTSCLAINDYRESIGLDQPFLPPVDMPNGISACGKIVGRLLGMLDGKYRNPTAVIDARTYDVKRRLLKKMLTLRPPDSLGNQFHLDMDQLLQAEAVDRGVVESSVLKNSSWPGTRSTKGEICPVALWQGDIVRLKIDAIVNAANSQLLGCFRPFHNCIDNAIHNAAGPRVREDCATIMRMQGKLEPAGQAKITRGYNLPAKYIMHTVGPIIADAKVSREAARVLASCYRACLNLASRMADIRSLAFCCLSTGVFGFPHIDAAGIAVASVHQWIMENPNALDLIVFNVFKDRDFRQYERLLIENG